MYVCTVQYMCILYHVLVLCNFAIEIGLHPTIFTINIHPVHVLYMYRMYVCCKYCKWDGELEKAP